MNVILDECFQFGLGAFETIGIEQGAPILLEKHLKRLERAAAFLNLGDLAERGITAQNDIKRKPIYRSSGRTESAERSTG